MKSTKKILFLLQLCLLSNIVFAQKSDWKKEASMPDANFYKIRSKYSAQMSDIYKKNSHTNLLTKIAKKLPENNPESPAYEAVKYKRWEWYWSSRVNSDGTFPTVAQQAKSLQEVMDLDEGSKSRATTRSVDAASKANWTNISKTTNDGGYWGSGLTASIAWHPTDDNTFWVTADVGGIWKTTNGGAGYTQIANSLPYQAVGAFAVDRDNVNNIIVATGNGLGSSGITTYSLGLYRTTNGGTNWTSVKGATFGEQIRYNTVVQSPTNASVFYATSNKDFLVSNDRGITWGPRFTAATPCSDFKISSANTSVQYMMLSGDLYKSTDGGATIQFVRNFTTNKSAIVRIALAPSNVNKVIVYTKDLGGSSFIFGSTDGGTTWSGKTNLGGSFPDIITFSASNSNVLYAGQVEMHKSTNFGTSWTRLTNYADGIGPNFITKDGFVEVHADHRNILVHPRTKEIYSCNDGGLDKLNETTNKWTRLSNGLLIAQYYSVASSENNATKLIVGSQDNGGAKRNSNGTWSNTNGGDAGKQAIDPTNDDIYYTHYNPDPLIHRTTDNGASTSYVKPTDATENWWVIPYQLKPGAPSTIFAGYHAVYRSDNRGDTWTKVSPDLTVKDYYSVLRELAVAPSNANYIYAANEFNFYKTNTGNTTGWTTLARSQPITGIAVKDNSPTTVYICNGGYSSGNKVFKSTDGGATFSNFSTGLPNIVMHDIIYQNNSNEHLYVATDYGVYYRTASMTSWARYGNNLPNVTVNELDIQYSAGKLRAATFGRGIYETDLLVTGTTTTPPAGTLANGTYTIVNRNSSQVMDVTAASTADNALIVQYTSNGGNNQKYQVTALGNGEYSIKPIHSLSLNKGLDMPGASLDNGTQVIQYGYIGAANQKWKIISVGGGFYQIQNVNSGKALVVENASTTAGARVIQFPYSGTLNEQWQFTPTTAAAARPVEISKIEVAQDIKQDLGAFPVPAVDQVEVTYNNRDKAQSAIVSVLNQYGMIVAQQKWELNEGANITQINTEKLVSGTYYVNIYGTKTKQHKKITIAVMK
jgi:hypothetical protein